MTPPFFFFCKAVYCACAAIFHFLCDNSEVVIHVNLVWSLCSEICTVNAFARLCKNKCPYSIPSFFLKQCNLSSVIHESSYNSWTGLTTRHYTDIEEATTFHGQLVHKKEVLCTLHPDQGNRVIHIKHAFCVVTTPTNCRSSEKPSNALPAYPLTELNKHIG